MFAKLLTCLLRS